MENFYLMVPIFGLYDVTKFEEIKFSEDSSDYIKNGYSLEERKKIYEALEWAKDNPDYDFKGVMKDAPVPYKLKFSNKEVYRYLMEFKKFMEDKEYELLTDDRPPIVF